MMVVMVKSVKEQVCVDVVHSVIVRVVTGNGQQFGHAQLLAIIAASPRGATRTIQTRNVTNSHMDFGLCIGRGKPFFPTGLVEKDLYRAV